MDRQEMIQHHDDPPKFSGYRVVGTKVVGSSERVIERLFVTLSEAMRAGEKMRHSGVADHVRIFKPRGKTHRLVRDERCTRAKRGKMRWTR